MLGDKWGKMKLDKLIEEDRESLLKKAKKLEYTSCALLFGTPLLAGGISYLCGLSGREIVGITALGLAFGYTMGIDLDIEAEKYKKMIKEENGTCR